MRELAQVFLAWAVILAVVVGTMRACDETARRQIEAAENRFNYEAIK